MNLGKLLIQIGADSDGLESVLNESETALSNFGKGAQKVGGSLTRWVSLPLAGIATAAFYAADQLDDAMDTIRTSTGATGDALAALGEDFDAVMKDTPAEIGDIAQAIGDLSTRTGLAGPPLQELARNVLNLSRLAGTEIEGTIAATTRLFGDWSIATAKQSGTLDYLWKVSQQTGIGVDTLAQKMVQFGAPLRLMGFEFEEAAVMMGKWEKEGVNAELVLGGLRIALSKGLDATAFQEVLSDIKALGPGAEATSLAMETFGKRAGADMAAAILEGRFAIDDLVKTINGSPETIASASADIAGFGENMLILKNNALAALQPLGAPMLQAFNDLMPTILGVLGVVVGVAQAFADLPTPMQNLILGAGALLAALGPIITVVGTISTVLPYVGIALKALSGPIGIAIGVASALVIAYKRWDEIEEFARAMYEGVQRWIGDKLTAVLNRVKAPIEAVTGWFRKMYDAVVGHSYVPDMIDGIAVEFNRLGEAMVRPTLTATQRVNRAMAEMTRIRQAAMASMGTTVSPMLADFDAVVDVSDKIVENIERSRDRIRDMVTDFEAMGGTLKLIDVNANSTVSRVTAPVATPSKSSFGGEVLGQISQIVSQFSPLGIVAMLLYEAFDALLPSIMALLQPMLMVAKALGTALAPILEAMFPVFKGLAIAATWLGQIFFTVAGGIATAVGSLVEALGKAIDKVPFLGDFGLIGLGRGIKNAGAGYLNAADALGDARKEIQALTWEDALIESSENAAESLDKLSESVVNAVSGYKIEGARFASIDATRPVTPAYAAPRVATSRPADTGGSAPVQIGTLTIPVNITSTGSSGAETYREFYHELDRRSRTHPTARPIFNAFPAPVS